MNSKKSNNKNNWKKLFLNRLKQNFSKKNNLWRCLGFAISLVIVLVPSLTCNLLIRNGLWTGSVAYNNGIAFSFLEGQTTLVYVIQSIICFAIFIAILFTDKWYYSALLSLAFIGGMFNIIDRATTFTLHQPDTVIDYLPTGGTTSNFPDVFILTGIIGYAVLYITLSIIKMVQDKKTKNGTSVHDKNKS